MIRIEFDKSSIPSATRDAAVALLDALSGLPVVTVTAKVFTTEKTTGIEITKGESRLSDIEAKNIYTKLVDATNLIGMLLGQAQAPICEDCNLYACTCGCRDYEHELVSEVPRVLGRCTTPKCPCEKYVHPNDL